MSLLIIFFFLLVKAGILTKVHITLRQSFLRRQESRLFNIIKRI